MPTHPIHIHPLVLIENTIQLYPEFNGQWQCDICVKTFDNNHHTYHCSACKFDICLTCVQPKKHPLHHPSHDLYYTDMLTVYPHYQGMWKCDGCHSLMAPTTEKCGYHCFRDEFDLCSECFNGKKFPVHIHPLKPAMSRFVYGDAPGLWVCDVCKRSGANMQTELSWHCGHCEFDVCKECRDLQVTVPQHNHSLRVVDPEEVYSTHQGSWGCDICKSTFHPSESVSNSDKPYHCARCQFDVCHSCMLEIRGGIADRDHGIDVTGPPASAYPTERPRPPPGRPHMPPQEFIENDDKNYDHLEDSERCIVCIARPKNATIVHGSTGHICCCLSCAYELERRGDPCPICRAPIDRVIRQFTS